MSGIRTPHAIRAGLFASGGGLDAVVEFVREEAGRIEIAGALPDGAQAALGELEAEAQFAADGAFERRAPDDFAKWYDLHRNDLLHVAAVSSPPVF